MCSPLPAATLAVSLLTSATLVAPIVPDAIAVPGEVLVATVHAQGAQVYECKSDDSGKLTWRFREPIATLLVGGETVGRHYAGPHWQLTDGSVLKAKVTGRAPAAGREDIPLLKLEVVSDGGAGQLSGVTTIQRINTRGGAAEGPCEEAGEFLSVPYAADYAFYRKPR